MKARACGCLTVGAWICALVIALPSAGASAATSVTLGDTTIRLESCHYYRVGDYTRFVYSVETAREASCLYWILGACDEVRASLWWASQDMEWVSSPISGIRLTPATRKEKVYLYLGGQWSAADAAVGAYVGQPGTWTFLTGWVAAPSCGAASLSIQVAAGGIVEFPPVTGPGLFEAANGTTLRVVSSTSGWILSVSESFVVPLGASSSSVARIFEVAVGDHSNSAGATDVSVAYALRVGETDFDSLPAGTYEIAITYTVVLD